VATADDGAASTEGKSMTNETQANIPPLPDPNVVASWTPEYREQLRAELDAADNVTSTTTPNVAEPDPTAPAVDNIGAVSVSGDKVLIARPFGTSGVGLPIHEAINVAAWILHHAGKLAGDAGLAGASAEMNALLGKVEELQSL
jgi:hypothetical protein